nr:reverse transcriptase domain-containing protein [Tanacetum cinerariifolium]
MSRDVLTVGSTMRIPLLFRGGYSQWSERFMNYLEEQSNGEAMINSIKNGDQPLPTVTQVSIVGATSSEQPPLIDKSINKTSKDLWDALERHMLGSEYAEQDRKATVLVKQYATMMRQNKNLLDINIDALYNILKQNQGNVNDAMKSKKKAVVIISNPLALDAEQTKNIGYNCKKEGHFAKDCKKAKVKDYEYYKTKMLLAKKDKAKQVLLAENHAWMESSSDYDQEINANMVFMAQMEKVPSDFKKSSSSSNDTIAEQTSSLKPYVPTAILEKIIIDLEDEVVSLLEKEKANLKTIESLNLKGYTFSSVRRPKVSSVEWKKKVSSNTSKDTQSAFVCNNTRNASCNARMNAYDDVNDFLTFDDGNFSLYFIRMISSPNHSTSDIKDAFSSNSPNYTTASPDYSLASSGNTPSESLINSYGLILIASPTLSLFHDDPYMKEILPPKKQGHERSSPSTSALPQAFEMGESSHKTSLKRHEKQIKEILNHVDELSLDRIEHIKDIIEGLGNGRVNIQHDFENLKTELQEARAQISKFQRKQMGNNNKISLARFRISTLELIIKDVQAGIRQLVADSVAAALEAQAANMANTNNTNRNLEPRETLAARKLFYRSNCTKDCKVKFATGTPIEDALSWWNSYAKPIGIDQADKITWTELKRLLINKYCPRTKFKKIEDEFYNLVVKGNDLKTYARRL